MKKEVFNKYTIEVCRAFDIEPEQLCVKTKKRNIVEARHLLYYLCFHRPMHIVDIQGHMKDRGYEVGHSTIIYGIGQADERVRHDRDYFKLVKKISAL